MTRLVLCAAVVLAACTTREATPPAPAGAAPAAARSAAGWVTIAPDSPMLARIRRAPAEVAEVPTDEIVSPGKIEVNPNRLSRVALPVAGRVTRVWVKIGDAVRAGDPLVSIQSPDGDAALSAYLGGKAGVAQAGAVQQKAQADFDRLSDLFAHDAVARKDVMSAESVLAQARAATAQAEAALQQARRRLEVFGLSPDDPMPQVVVKAPLSGKVLELSVVPGEYRTDTTTSVLTLADLQTVWVTSQVPENYIRFIQPGELVEINLMAYPGETFNGRVSRIADTVDPQSRTVKVQAEVQNPQGRFRPEMYGSIHHVEALTRRPTVPVTAVIQDGARMVVFVERTPGRFEEVDVTIGGRRGDRVGVLTRLSGGESVAVDGGMLLKGMVSGGQP